MAVLIVMLPLFLDIQSEYIITLRRLNKKPVLDGILEAEEWNGAYKISNFIESYPEENIKPPVRTEVYIGIYKDALYIAFRCEDSKKAIRASLNDRDRIFQDDAVFMYIDVLNDPDNILVFGTNPKGIQYDAVMKEPLEDFSWDANWNVKTKINENYWVAEFEIPLNILRINNSQKHWRINFKRIRPRKKFEIYYWSPVSRDNPSFISQAGLIYIPFNLKKIKSKRGSLIPFLMSYQDVKNKENKVKYKLGFTSKYSIYLPLALDFTFNPDYAQIETDAFQIDVNTPYALWYPEKRPFFMEGKTYIEFPIDVIYTRTINEPLFAGKISGKVGSYALYYLSAIDKKTLWVVPYEEWSSTVVSERSSYSDILRIRRDLFEDSYIGFLFAHREINRGGYANKEGFEFGNWDGYSRVLGMDTRLRFKTHYTFEYSGFYSFTKEPFDTSLYYYFDGENLKGRAQYSNFNVYFRNLILNASYEEISPDFRSDFGYIWKNNYRDLAFSVQPRIYPNKYGIVDAYMYLKYEREVNFENIKKEEDYNISCGANLPLQTNISFSYTNYYKRYYDYEFKNNYTYFISLRSSPYKWVYFGGSGYQGKTIRYTYPPQEAFERGFNLWFSFKPFYFLNLEISGSRYYLYREKYRNIIYDVTTFLNEMNLQFTRSLSFRLILQYYTYSRTLQIFPLISYEANPFTVFYLGMNMYAEKGGEKFDFKYLRSQEHQIFLKFQYWFKI